MNGQKAALVHFYDERIADARAMWSDHPANRRAIRLMVVRRWWIRWGSNVAALLAVLAATALALALLLVLVGGAS